MVKMVEEAGISIRRERGFTLHGVTKLCVLTHSGSSLRGLREIIKGIHRLKIIKENTKWK